MRRTLYLEPHTYIKVGNYIIKSAAIVKFLGIHFDYDMSFKTQVDKIRQKCFRRKNILKYLGGIKWGADPLTLTLLYKSLIRSIIDYNSFIYFPNNKELVLKLERIQFTALKTVLGYRISILLNILCCARSTVIS